jgi:hypothetical protein
LCKILLADAFLLSRGFGIFAAVSDLITCAKNQAQVLNNYPMTQVNHPGIEQLHDPEKYIHIKTLTHNEIAHFVIGQLKKLKWPMLSFYIFNCIILMFMAVFSTHIFLEQTLSLAAWGLYMFYGIVAGMILVIPFHEGLHGLAYRIAGARKIKYGMDLKQMLFYASAPGFVADRKSFLLVALSPFIVINLFFSLGMLFGSAPIQWASIVAIFIHSTLCIGDFAMINFFASYPEKNLYTYDEEKSQITRFFAEK